MSYIAYHLPAMNDNWKIRLLLSVVVDYLHKIKKRVRLLWNTYIDQMKGKKWEGNGREVGGKRGKRGRKEIRGEEGRGERAQREREGDIQPMRRKGEKKQIDGQV